MSGDARRSFLADLTSLRQSLESPLVSGGDAVGRFLRRGLTIVSYNILEAFISERLEEIAQYVNGGIVHFGDLPDKLQRAATFDVLRFANSRLQRGSLDLESLLTFAADVGHSLVASSGALKLSALTWQWAGSNMTADDVHRAMRLFHVKTPWVTIENISQRIGVPISDPKGVLVTLLRERNKCAHESAYEVSNLWIRAVPHHLQVIGMGVDISVTVAAHELHIGTPDFLSNENWMSSDRVKFRFVQERTGNWAEILENRTRALHVSTDKDSLIKRAVGSSRGGREPVIIRDRTLQLVDWIYPELP